MKPGIAIIIVNYNSSDDTIECIESLKKVNYDNLKIIVIDNASQKEECEKLESLKDCAEVVFSNINLGFAGGNNMAIKKCIALGYDYILLLNEDTVVDKNIINNMLRPLCEHSDVGVVSPQVFNYYDRDAVMNSGGYIDFWRGNTKNHYCEKYCGNGFYTTFASGSCLLMKSSILEKTGFLSEDYFLYYEDTDFSVKVLKAGYKIWFEPTAHVYHKGGASTVRWSPNYQYYFTRGRFMFIKNNIDFPQNIAAYIYSILFVLKSSIIRKGSIKYLGKGFVDFLKGKKGKLENVLG